MDRSVDSRQLPLGSVLNQHRRLAVPSQSDSTANDNVACRPEVSGPTGGVRANTARIIRASLSYGAFQYVVLVISFVKGIYVARYLGPTVLGSYGLVVLITGYFQFANLGVHAAMNLEVSTRRDHSAGAEVLGRVVESAWTYTLMTGVVLACTVFIIRQWFSSSFPPDIARYLYALCFIGFCGQFRLFTLTLARLRRRYRLINVLELISAGAVLSVVLVFGARYKLDAVVGGMLLASIITLVIGLVAAIQARVVRIRVDMIPTLVAVGIPLFIYEICDHVFVTVDRWMIATWLERQDLGYVTLSYSFATSTLVLLSAFTYLSYPDFLGAFHLTSGDEREKRRVLESFRRQTVTLGSVATGLGVLGMVCIEPVIEVFLPQYGRSVGIYRILMIGMLPQRIACFAATFLVANRRQKLLVGLVAVSVLVAVSLHLTAIGLGWGVEGIAAGSAVALAVYALLMVSAALRAMSGLHVRNLGMVYGKYALLLAVVVPLLLVAPEHLYISLIAFLFIYAKENAGLVRMMNAWRAA